MSSIVHPLPSHLTTPTKLNTEISITGKWVPLVSGNLFRQSSETKELLKEWEAIHISAKASQGVLSTELNHAIGEEAMLVHHVFDSPLALQDYFSITAAQHIKLLRKIAKPERQLIRGVNLPATVISMINDMNVPAVFGQFLFGYVKHGYEMPDPSRAIQVTAKWTCHNSPDASIEALKYYWQMVGTDAYSLEKGLVRFEVYKVIGEDALIIHETFDSTEELMFHLTKGTADKYKKDIDRIAAPECYYFRGPVSWTIRTYSKFMHLPATYSSRGSHFTAPGGSMSDGLTF